MSAISIKYNGETIKEIDNPGTITLSTAGKYCEDNISILYSGGGTSVNFREYEITLTKQSGWILLTELDSEALEHINDSNLIVSFFLISDYSYQHYSGTFYSASNNIVGDYSGKAIYGTSNRMQSETNTASNPIFYPANNTSTDTSLKGFGMFRLDGAKYYIRASDGYVAAGTYRLVIVW